MGWLSNLFSSTPADDPAATTDPQAHDDNVTLRYKAALARVNGLVDKLDSYFNAERAAQAQSVRDLRDKVGAAWGTAVADGARSAAAHALEVLADITSATYFDANGEPSSTLRKEATDFNAAAGDAIVRTGAAVGDAVGGVLSAGKWVLIGGVLLAAVVAAAVLAPRLMRKGE